MKSIADSIQFCQVAALLLCCFAALLLCCFAALQKYE